MSAGATAAAVAGAAAATTSSSAHTLIYTFLVMTPQQFMNAVNSVKGEVIVVEVVRKEGVIHKSTAHYYVTSLQGLIAVTKSTQPISLPSHAKVISASDIILPAIVRETLNNIKRSEHPQQ